MNVVRAMCADLMFAFFICPAICDPEPYGITSDAPISYIANNNLMQVAQILQVLALPNQDVDAKNRDLYDMFDKVYTPFQIEINRCVMVNYEHHDSNLSTLIMQCVYASCITNEGVDTVR